MMKTLRRAGFFASLLMAAMQCQLLAQSPVPSPAPRCENSHRTLAPKNPHMAANGSILAGQVIVQAKLILDENTTVQVVEHPRSGKDLDSYNSTIVIQRGREQEKYPLKELIKGGEFLRLVETVRLCSAPDQGSIVLAFEAGSTGAAEGFAVVRYSSQVIDVQALPMADQGRIVVSKAEPNKVELWSATGSAGVIDCDACKKHYAVQDCEVGEHPVTCKRRPGTGEVRSPDKFIGARIEVR